MVNEETRIKNHNYYLTHKKEAYERNKNNYERNKDVILKKHSDYYYTNKENINIKNRIRWHKNKDRYLKSSREYRKKWYLQNKDEKMNKDNERRKILRKTNPQYAIKERLRRKLRSALKVYGNGKNMKSDKYGIDYQKIINHLKPFPSNIQNYHIDHIKPLCKFDLTDFNQIKDAFKPENHQWLTQKQNLIKGAKHGQ